MKRKEEEYRLLISALKRQLADKCAAFYQLPHERQGPLRDAIQEIAEEYERCYAAIARIRQRRALAD